VLAGALVAAGGSAMQQGPAGYTDRREPQVRLVTREQAVEWGLQGEPFVIAFGQNQNGTELAYRYLRAAAGRGAGWVSDVQVVLRADGDGEARVCVTRLIPSPKTRTVSHMQMVQRPPERHMVMKPVTRQVTEYQHRCHMVSKPHREMKIKHESRYDYSCKCTRYESKTVWETNYRMENECKNEPVTRSVTRYEYQYEQRYQPPEWKQVFSRETSWDLEESAPDCGALPAEYGNQTNLIRGTIWRSPPKRDKPRSP
jgi:hypothetical protein